MEKTISETEIKLKMERYSIAPFLIFTYSADNTKKYVMNAIDAYNAIESAYNNYQNNINNEERSIYDD